MRAARLIVALALGLWALPAHAQNTFPTPNSNYAAPSQVPLCPTGNGITYVPCNAAGALAPGSTAGLAPVDPCLTGMKASVSISTSSAATAQLVTGNSGGIYVCSLSLSIAGSATTAATAQLEYSKAASCGSGVTALTGTYGSNDAAVSTTPTVINYGGNVTILFVPPGNNLCLVTAGNAVFVQGALSYAVGK